MEPPYPPPCPMGLSRPVGGARPLLLLVVIAIAVACTGGPAADTGTSSPTPSGPTLPMASTTAPTTGPSGPSRTPSTSVSSTAPTAPVAGETEGGPRLDRGTAATAERLTGSLDALAAIGPRPAGSLAEADAFAWIARTLLPVVGRPLGREAVPLPDGSVSENRWIPATDAGPVLLLGAHVDSVAGSPGLDDNGSGVVVLIELARRLADRPSPVPVEIVFFGAEERLPGYGRDAHHHGSRQMAARRAAAGTLPAAMVSVDMVGVGEDLVAVVYEDTDPATAEALVAAGAALGVTVTPAARGDISDHEAFARYGVPSAFLWRPDNPAWHTPGDDHVVLEHLLEDLALLERLLADLGS